MARIIVPVKYSIDIDELTFGSDGTPKIKEAPKKINPVDKSALEAALRIKEKHSGEVLALTVGPEEAHKALREALAMGADDAYHVVLPEEKKKDTYLTAKILAEAIKKIGDFDLVITGKITVDGWTGVVSIRLAEELGLPNLGFTAKLEVNDNKVKIRRDMDAFVEEVEAEFPVVINVVQPIYEPRFVNFIKLKKAMKHPIHKWTVEELGLSDSDIEDAKTLEQIDLRYPQVERKKIKIEEEDPKAAAQKLVDMLMKDGVLSK